MKKLLFTCFLLGCTSSINAQVISPFADTFRVSVDDGLQLVLSRDARSLNGNHLILRATYAGDASARPLLRQIVSDYREGRDEFGGYFKIALEALWELGERREYFLDLVRQWDQGVGSPWLDVRIRRKRDPHYWIAFQAALRLAREPTPDILATLDSVRVATNSDGYLGNSYFKARNMASDLERYEQMKAVDERISWAVEWAGYGLDMLPGINFGALGYLYPKAGVGRRWLEELAQQYPQEVAQAIRGIDHGDVELDWGARRHLSAFTSDVVRALLADCLTDEAIDMGCRP